MKSFFAWLASPIAIDYTSNAGYIYKRMTSILFLLTIIVILFLLFFLSCNLLTGLVTFLLVAAASAAGGAAIGFLFGLPKAEKYRFIKKEDVDHNSKDYSYGDNTNLEEVSDWLTKIIVGLTLIKLNTIRSWIDQAAHSIDNAFHSNACVDPSLPLNAYVFGYCTIVLYFLAGAGLCYLWARTNLSVLLTLSKITQRDIEKQQLISKIQSLTNPDLKPTDGMSSSFVSDVLTDDQKGKLFPSEKFRNQVESVYNAKSVFDKTDLQKGRWGGESKKGDFILEANYIESILNFGVYRLQLLVRSLNVDNPVKGEVAFFIHDTFPSEIVFTVANNNKAEIMLSAYESFVAGARLEDGTELELDINKVKGFPEKFYWKA